MPRVLDRAGVLAPTAARSAHIRKRALGPPADRDGAEDAATSEAIGRCPAKAALFARVKDDGRAEAALIAVAGMKRRHCAPLLGETTR